MLQKLKQIAVIFESQRNPIFNYPLERQRDFLESFTVPKDDIERSYNQYKCQLHLYGKAIAFLWNVASFILYFPMFRKYRLQKQSDIGNSLNKAVFFDNGNSLNIVPTELYEEFGDIDKTGEINVLRLSDIDVQYLKRVKARYPGAWYFRLKMMIKIAQYRAIIDKFNPQALIVSSEYSFTSSALREFCQSCNVQLINVQHGEKVFYIGDAFFHFDRCYVWDDFYEKLFISLRAETSQFKIAIPQSLKFRRDLCVQKKNDYTYYLGNEFGTLLQAIYENLIKLKMQGYKVSVRPHPQYSIINEVEKVFFDINIESFATISVEESILQTRNVISLFSTVLQQAYANDVNIIIDDISDSKRYAKLFELQYSMLRKEHKLLSQELENS